MVDVGTMQIKGEIEDDALEAGLNRIEAKLSDIEAKVSSSSGSFNILASSTAKVAKDLLTIGSAGVSAMLALASSAPAVADEMANIKNSMREITFALGDIFEPVFQTVASDLQDVSGALQGNLSSIQNLIPEASAMAAGAAAGYALFGPAGIFIGAALGYAAGNAFEAGAAELGANIQTFTGQVEQQQEQFQGIEQAGFLTSGQVEVVSIIEVLVNGVASLFDRLMGNETELEVEGGVRTG